jgi:hypothetical protein
LRSRRRGPLLAARVLRQDAREDVKLAILDFGLPILDSFGVRRAFFASWQKISILTN